MRNSISPIVFAISIASALVGCRDEPAAWAQELVPRLNCGMTVAQVGQITDREVVAIDPRREWATHQIGRDTSQTVIWLNFENDRLQSAQIAWNYNLARMHERPRVNLCKS